MSGNCVAYLKVEKLLHIKNLITTIIIIIIIIERFSEKAFIAYHLIFLLGMPF